MTKNININSLVRNIRTNSIGRIANFNNGKYEVEFQDGSTKEVAEATMKRWYEEAKAPEADEFESFVDGHATSNEGSVYEMNVKGRKALKVNGNMYAAVRYSKKGVELWLRSEPYAFELGALNVTYINHTFNARVKFTELNYETRAIITKLLDKAMLHQLFKKATSKKALKEDAKAAKAAIA